MKRQLIIVAIAITIFALSFVLSEQLSKSKTPPPKKVIDNTATVFVEKVQNSNVPTLVKATGSLIAQNRIDIFAEVQGVFESSDHPFKAGSPFKKGEELLQLNSDVFRANLVAQRSNFQSLIASVLADIQIDFSSELKKWEAYLEIINPEQNLPSLPKVESKQLKLYLTGKGVFSSFYNIQNAELTLQKYQILAPFNGVLTEANITVGSLVRPGQKIGSFIELGKYELETAVPTSLASVLKIGQRVELIDPNTTQSYSGTIIRKNAMVNTGTQTTNVYVQVYAKDLAEGMFMEARILGADIQNAYEVPRSVLINNEALFILNKGKLVKRNIELAFLKQETAIVKGLKDGDSVLVKMAPNAFAGMKATAFKASK